MGGFRNERELTYDANGRVCSKQSPKEFDSHKPTDVIDPENPSFWREIYGPGWDKKHWGPHIRNIYTGATMSSTHHNYNGETRTRADFQNANPTHAYCLHWVRLRDGSLGRCGEEFTVKSHGCGKHPNSKGRGPNICHQSWERGTNVTWADLDDQESITEHTIEESDTDEFYHKRVDEIVVELKGNGQDPITAEKAALAAVEREFYRKFYLSGRDLLIEEELEKGNYEVDLIIQEFEATWRHKMQRRKQVRSDLASLLLIYEPVKETNPVLDQLQLKAQGKVSKTDKKKGSQYKRGDKN